MLYTVEVAFAINNAYFVAFSSVKGWM